MQTDIVVQKLDAARTALAEAKTIQETKRILDVAAAAEILARRQKLGEEAILYATAIKVEALAQLGRMLKGTPRNKGVRLVGGSKKYSGGSEVIPPDDIPTLAELGLDKKTSKLAQDVASLPPEKLEAVKNGIVSLSKVNAHVAYNTGEYEWYTPPEYIAAARDVMGGIDLDPASSDIANKTVGASKYYTKQNSGLEPSNEWSGRVWMNPPYASGLIEKFVMRYVYEIRQSTITEGIVLVNNATETEWFGKLVNVSKAVLFTNHRVKFLSPNGKQGAPLQGQAILYYGNNTEKFLSRFSEFGWGARLC